MAAVCEFDGNISFYIGRVRIQVELSYKIFVPQFLFRIKEHALVVLGSDLTCNYNSEFQARIPVLQSGMSTYFNLNFYYGDGGVPFMETTVGDSVLE